MLKTGRRNVHTAAEALTYQQVHLLPGLNDGRRCPCCQAGGVHCCPCHCLLGDVVAEGAYDGVALGTGEPHYPGRLLRCRLRRRDKAGEKQIEMQPVAITWM